MRNSIWQKTVEKLEIKKKTLPKKVDVLIIGGGITGLSTASFLRDTKMKIAILEKGKLYQGITARTTAKLSFLQKDIYGKLKIAHNEEISHQYYLSQKEAISLFLNNIETYKIACDLEKTTSILFAMEPKNVGKVKQEEELLNKWGEATQEVLHDKISYGFSLDDCYSFHPLKYLKGLVESFPSNVSIFEDTLVFQMKEMENGYQVMTTRGNFFATSVVVACHYPFFLFPSLIPLKTYMKREYVNVGTSKQEKNDSLTAINVDDNLFSLRFYKGKILYGSNEHLLIHLSKNQDALSKSQKDFEKYFQTKPTMTWLNQDIYSHDHLPIIGMARKLDKRLFLATAYGAWGMTNGTLAGKILADLITQGKSPYQNLFAPTRKNTALLLNSMVGSLGYLKPYLEPIFTKKKVTQVKIDGKKYNLYIDEDSKKHYILAKCPHMKCPLLFNAEEKTWDCPCHGSRFDLDGNLLYAPSKRCNGRKT